MAFQFRILNRLKNLFLRLSFRMKSLVPILAMALVLLMQSAFSMFTMHKLSSLSRETEEDAAQVEKLTETLASLMADEQSIRTKAWFASYKYDKNNPVKDKWVTEDIMNLFGSIIGRLNEHRKLDQKNSDHLELNKKMVDAIDAEKQIAVKFTTVLQAGEVNREELFKIITQISEAGSRFQDMSSGLLYEVKQTNNTNFANMAKNSEQERSRAYTTNIASLILTLFVVFISFVLSLMTAGKLAEIAKKLGYSGSTVGSASAQISTSSQTVSSGTSESASSIQQVVASIEEMSSVVKMNADNAREASKLASDSFQSAASGQTEIENLIKAMLDISDSSRKIEEIITVINAIAFQTNLLALNASVEAARAGEHGKGFAVVAESVRGLAQKSAAASKDIGALIKDTVKKVEQGSKVADKSRTVLNQIVESIQKVSDLNGEIAAACSEQTTGINQIGKAMSELDGATQQNAAASEQVAATAKEMSAQSEVLQQMMGQLGTIVSGGDTDSISITEEQTQNHSDVA